MDDRERLRIQMMGFLDDELDEDDRRAFMEQCYADPELAAELASYRKLNDIADSMRLREPEDHEYERFFARVTARMERRSGFLLLFVGLALLTGWGVVEIFLSTLPLVVKLGLGITLLGAAILISSVTRARLRMRRLDRYQGVQR